MPSIPEQHPLRNRLASEIHSRPYTHVKAPARVSHIAMMNGEQAGDEDLEHLRKLCRHFDVPQPADNATHFSQEFSNFFLKWERHTEFSSYTLYAFGEAGIPFEKSPLNRLPTDWLQNIPGQLISASHVVVETEQTPERSIGETAALFDDNTVIGSQVLSGKALIWTDGRIHGDGFGRILVRDLGLNPRGLGRLVQRLLEIETYRMTAMLAYPLARKSIPEIAGIEQTLSKIVKELPMIKDVGGERKLLSQLSHLAADVEAISVETNYRFSAARAYFSLLEQRVRELREERIPTLQPSGEFIFRRIAPAMATCETMETRIEKLSRHIARASNLLRTRVDVALEEQNRDLLQSMDRRAKRQLRLQQTVEGLSVVAISYYVLSLISYLAKGTEELGFAVNPYVVVMVAFPIVLGLVWSGVRHIRRALKDDNEAKN